MEGAGCKVVGRAGSISEQHYLPGGNPGDSLEIQQADIFVKSHLSLSVGNTICLRLWAHVPDITSHYLHINCLGLECFLLIPK